MNQINGQMVLNQQNPIKAINNYILQIMTMKSIMKSIKKLIKKSIIFLQISGNLLMIKLIRGN